MIEAINSVSKMSALGIFLKKGMGLPENTFYDTLQGGAHLLAPTGSDL
jgi:hypothetical protein